MKAVGKKALIVGSTGFVGRQLKSYLEENRGNYQLDEMNRKDGKSFEDALEKAPDIIFYTAGVVASDNLEELFEGNVLHLHRLLSAVAKKCPEAFVVALGSAAAYGMPKRLPIKESDPLEPISNYGLSMKMRSDLMSYFRNSGLRVVEARLFNAIGPDLSEKTSIGSFLKQIATIKKSKSKPCINTGFLENKRDFTDIRDIASALAEISENCQPSCPVFNVCSGKSAKISEVLGLLGKEAGLALEIRQESGRLRKFDIPDSVGDNSLLTSKTSWKPKFSLEESAEFALAN